MSALVLAGVVVSGAWTQLDEIGWLGWLPLVVVFALDRFASGQVSWGRWSWPPATIERGPFLACAGICALLLAHLGLTAVEEFGFGGDEGYHLSATRAFALYFMQAGPWLAAVSLGFGVLLYLGWRYAPTAAMAGLLAASYALPESALFGRYPTGFYLIATPLNVAFEVMRVPYPFTANHVINVLSAPVWLFALRPLVVGRWPDWRVLPVVLLVYFQPLAFVYGSSALLEPWALVCLLLSAEVLAADEPSGRWRAVVLCSLAVAFKEAAILLLPTVWLLACVEWRNGRPTLRRGGIAVGVAAVTPFVIYYAVRRGMQVERGYELAGAAGTWTLARVAEWLTNVRAQIGVGGMVTIVVAMVLTARRGALWMATALAVAVFFFADAGSLPYTGYGRFLAFALIAVCGAVFAAVYRPSATPRFVLALCTGIAVLHAVPVTRMLTLDLQPDHERNSLEWHRSLIRLPIRALVDRIAATQGGDQVRRVRVVTFGTDLTSLHVAYPDLASTYELVRGDVAGADCRCRDHAEAVVAGFEWPAHFGDTPADRSAFEQSSTACVRQVESTCLASSVYRDRSGAAIGALGVGKMLLLATPQDHESPKR